MSNYDSIIKRMKLDRDHLSIKKSSSICHFLNLPEEMVTNILSYVGLDVGDENPNDDEEDKIYNIDFGDSTKYKFKLSLVCSKFHSLVNKPGSWKRNHVLTIYPKSRIVSIRTGEGLRINGILLMANKAVEAIQKFLQVTCVKQIIVVDIIHWGINDYSKSVKEAMLECFQKNEQRLKETVKKITLHGFLNHNKTKDLVLWFCNNLSNLRSIDLTMAIDGAITEERFQLNFEDTQIVNCPLEKIKLSRFRNSPNLFKIFEEKRIKELIMKIEWYIENGTEMLILISNKIADGTLRKLVVSPVVFHTDLMYLHMNQWLTSVRSEVLCNLRHLEFDQVFVSDIANIPNILTVLPRSLSYLKIHCVNSFHGNRIQVLRFLSHVVMAFFETSRIKKAEINFGTTNYNLDDSQFKRYRKFARRQWQGISVEKITAEVEGRNYRFRKYEKCLRVRIT